MKSTTRCIRGQFQIWFSTERRARILRKKILYTVSAVIKKSQTEKKGDIIILIGDLSGALRKVWRNICWQESEISKCQWIDKSYLANFVNEIRNWVSLVDMQPQYSRGNERYG